MKAVLCKAFGEPESLSLEDVPAPTPGPAEVLIDVHCAALNFPDVLMIQGKYQVRPDFPFSPGGELAGKVAAIGADVSHVRVGERVFCGTGHGAFAEQVAVPEAVVRSMPKSMSFAEASGFSTTYGTSYHALKQRAQLLPGETLLVLGAAGGVGLTAVELGKTMGARVIAAASTEKKLAAAAAAGADELIDYSDGLLKDKVKELTSGKGADVIYDPVGGDMFDQCMRCINWKGRILVVGFTAGSIPKVPINLILLKGCQLVGVFYGAFTAREPAENAKNFSELLQFYEEGRIHPHVGQEFSMQHYAEALRCLSNREAIGKVVLNIKS